MLVSFFDLWDVFVQLELIDPITNKNTLHTLNVKDNSLIFHTHLRYSKKIVIVDYKFAICNSIVDYGKSTLITSNSTKIEQKILPALFIINSPKRPIGSMVLSHRERPKAFQKGQQLIFRLL